MSLPETATSTKRSRRPRSFTVAALIVVAWLALGGIGGPLFGELNKVQKNDNSEFLPAKAQSAQAQKVLNTFSEGSGELPFTVTFEKQSKLTQNDVTAIMAAVAKAANDPKVAPYLATRKVGDKVYPYIFPQTPQMAAQAISKDGQAFAALVFINFKKLSDAEGFNAIEGISGGMAKHVEAVAPGVKGYVTGAGGLFAELAKVFGELDSKLLLVTLLVVALILLIVYRSPFLWILPLISAIFALSLSVVAVYALAKNDIIRLNGQSQGIMFVLVLGAATDYSLLLISRYREELRRHENKYDAMRTALRASWEPILASAGTVAVGLMCLTLSQLKSNAALGPTGAIGVLCAFIASMTFLPAALLLVGRRMFWPFVPRYGSELAEIRGIWAKVAKLVGRRSTASAVITGLALAALCAFVPTLKAEGVSSIDTFVNQDNAAVAGFRVLERHDLVPPAPDAEVVARTAALTQVEAAAMAVKGVGAARIRMTVDPATMRPTPSLNKAGTFGVVDVTYSASESDTSTQATTGDLRKVLAKIDGAGALVGGNAGAQYDVQQASRHDRKVIIPIVLVVIALILALLLRSLLAPLILIGTVVLSFGATLGVCALVFNHVFKFAGADSSFPLFAFVFLVAVGIDYNIFLMTRVREESMKEGTRSGTLHALAVTGAVITSAGIVLAATFSVLGILPLVFLAEIGFAVAFGVLLDTIIVRSLLVPALVHRMGKIVWWPSRLARDPEPVVQAQ
jgi:RND superfamily putative drug exporter